MRKPYPRRVLTAALLLAAACNAVEGGNRDATRADCDTLCGVQVAGEGCKLPRKTCEAACKADTDAFDEVCMVKSRAYYQCAAALAWACPAAPDQPEAADTACDAERSAWLLCKVTGE